MQSSSSSVLTDSSCTTIVPYDPPDIIKPFREKTRKFLLAGKEWNVVQDWDNTGVAGVVWEAGIELSKFLERNLSLIKGKRVIELGAGTGLAGMVAGTLGASCVDITDRNVLVAEENMKNNPIMNCTTAVIPYEWGQPLQYPLTLPYDLVLGSDVIYIEDTYHLLIQSLKFICRRNTVILLASKLRYEKVDNFLKLLEENNFQYQLVNKNDSNNVYIYQITAS